MQRDYAASNALRRRRNGFSSGANVESMLAKRSGRRTAVGFYLVLGVALMLAPAFAFPDKASDILHNLAALR